MRSVLFLLSLVITFIMFTESKTQDVCPTKSPATVSPTDEWYAKMPYVDGGASTFYGGEIRSWAGKKIDVTSPIVDSKTQQRAVIGSMAQMTELEALEVVETAKSAWSGGQGTWPQMAAKERVAALEGVIESLLQRREEIINVLIWEICKNSADAAAEFDRTITFTKAMIQAYKEDANQAEWRTVSGVMAKVRRAAIGIVMCLGPFNYPINETYATLLPALLSGNVVILKVPTLGGLAHILTIEAFQKHLPPGTLNFVSGSGRATMSPMMKTGAIDVLAFIGGSKAADAIIKDHPHPHRLNVFLQLEGKNPGIVLPDADLDSAVEQVTLGSTSYNGQRCTAIKLVFVHRSIAEPFMKKLVASIDALPVGLPWEQNVKITPLPEPNKPGMLRDWIEDAVAKGARVVNDLASSGGSGGTQEGALCHPAVVYPVNADMRLWHEEQFGPVIPVAVFDDISEVQQYVAGSPYGQQAAIFTQSTEQGSDAAALTDTLSTIVGRININTQCARSPDVFPFSGRRSSALGTMSMKDTVSLFSTETVLATKKTDTNEALVLGLDDSTRFLARM
jgi:glyceraldehyde-3-phosphate dehydrogenase (NADP+)